MNASNRKVWKDIAADIAQLSGATSAEQTAIEICRYLGSGDKLITSDLMSSRGRIAEIIARNEAAELAQLRAAAATFRDLLVYLNAAEASDAYGAVRQMADDLSTANAAAAQQAEKLASRNCRDCSTWCQIRRTKTYCAQTKPSSASRR